MTITREGYEDCPRFEFVKFNRSNVSVRGILDSSVDLYVVTWFLNCCVVCYN